MATLKFNYNFLVAAKPVVVGHLPQPLLHPGNLVDFDINHPPILAGHEVLMISCCPPPDLPEPSTCCKQIWQVHFRPKNK